MVATLLANPNQLLRLILTIRQKVDFTGSRQVVPKWGGPRRFQPEGNNFVLPKGPAVELAARPLGIKNPSKCSL